MMISAVILAAGESRRMGYTKQLLPWSQGKLLLQHVLHRVSTCPAIEGDIRVVIGAEKEKVKQSIQELNKGFQVIENPNYQEGLMSSIRAGLKDLPARTEAVLFFLGDKPFWEPALVARMVEEYHRSNCKIVAPFFAGRQGHPVLVSTSLLSDLHELKGDYGLKPLIESNEQHILSVDVEDSGILLDIDDIGEYKKYRPQDDKLILIKGAGEMASAVAHRLFMAGLQPVMTELNEPMVVRRRVAFAQAVYDGETEVEGIKGEGVSSIEEIKELVNRRRIPVFTGRITKRELASLIPGVIIDATMTKNGGSTEIWQAPLVIGLGPGFVAGRNVDAVVETMRGHNLGRVYYEGEAAPNTGVPGDIAGYTAERVMRSPVQGIFQSQKEIGEKVTRGQIVGNVGDQPVLAPLSGVIRGLIHDGVKVAKGLKLGDIDPRGKAEYCFTISEKGRAIAGGVLEAILHLKGRVQEQ